jgi:hypothetical protein
MQNTHKDLQGSGAYDKPFYITRFISDDAMSMKNIEWNTLLYQRYRIDKDDLFGVSTEELLDVVNEDFYEALNSTDNTYYAVSWRKYNEQDAYKCNLIPFKIISEGYELYLVTSTELDYGVIGCELDAYYFLQTGKMDPKSRYFSDKNYFKSMVSTEIFNAIEDKFGGVTV